jgi:hypothetical protein
MLKSVNVILSAIFLAASGFSHVALADDVSHSSTVLEITDGASQFSSKFKGHNGGNSFSEKFTFNLTGLYNFAAELTTKHPNVAVGSAIAGFDLYDANALLIAQGTHDSVGKDDRWNLSFSNLAGGAYFLQVRGDMISDGSDTISGSMSLSPVPEAEIYTMLLAGLGLICFLSRRRQVSEKFK